MCFWSLNIPADLQPPATAMNENTSNLWSWNSWVIPTNSVECISVNIKPSCDAWVTERTSVNYRANGSNNLQWRYVSTALIEFVALLLVLRLFSAFLTLPVKCIAFFIVLCLKVWIFNEISQNHCPLEMFSLRQSRYHEKCESIL